MLSTEFKIKEILGRDYSPEKKAEMIIEFMEWDKAELLEVILRIGTEQDFQQSEIIRHFWDKRKK